MLSSNSYYKTVRAKSFIDIDRKSIRTGLEASFGFALKNSNDCASFVRLGADVNTCDEEGSTILHHVMKRRDMVSPNKEEIDVVLEKVCLIFSHVN